VYPSSPRPDHGREGLRRVQPRRVPGTARRGLLRRRAAALCALVMSTFATQTVLASDSGYPYPFPYERHLVHDFVPSYTTYPYSTIGKLFFQDGKTPKMCSASVITASNLSLVITAAHCIHSGGPGGHFFSYFLFAPQYDQGATPFGTFSWRYAAVPHLWTQNGPPDFSQDYGFLVMNQTSGGYLQNTVGSLGYVVNTRQAQHWHILGYPANPPFTGKDMVQCTSSWARDDSPSNPDDMGTGCDMQGGASGSPWIVNFGNDSSSPHNQVNSVYSYYLTNPNQPGAIYGPWFGPIWSDTYSAVQNK
jgi:V8-like Glu-specific endopeptidase